MTKIIIGGYHGSFVKRLLDIVVSFFCIFISLPLTVFIVLAIRITSKGPVFFLQKRIGKNGKVFKIIKFRTMVPNASKIQSHYRNLNEADGPVFKINNDPRFTGFGKILSKTGLDELPQLINILRGEMSLIGPRPLPVNEANKLTKQQKIRELIKPGITSSWVIGGSHRLSFKKWMELDADYVKNANFVTDISIACKTFGMILSSILKL